MPHDEARIRGKRTAAQHHGIGVKLKEMLHGAIEQRRGFIAVDEAAGTLGGA